MSEPLKSEAGEDPGTLAIKRTRIGYAPALVGSRPSQVMSLPAEEPASTADMVPEIAAAAAATATGPHQTIVTPRFGGVLRKRDTKAMGAPERTRLRLVPGKLIPGTRYRLVRWLGEGGMGVVYEAEHEDIERRVALKILRIEASDD